MSDTRHPVTILGLGLIGGSLAGALTRVGWRVAGWDPNPAAGRGLRRRRMISHVTAAAEDALEGAAVIVLAGPPRAIRDWLPRLQSLAPEAAVTDVGSVKGPVARLGRRLLGERFVPGHPVAGREMAGSEAARRSLFRGAPWALCGGSPAARARVEAVVRAAGARPVTVSPTVHDRDMALVSHLPQLLASLLLAETARRRPGAFGRSGSGFADWARLGASPPDLWNEILFENTHAVRMELEYLERALARFRTAWERNPEAPVGLLKQGRKGFQLWHGTKSGD